MDYFWSMGITICPKHGTQGIRTSIEPDIADKIHMDIFIPENEVLVVESFYYDEQGELWFNQSDLLYKSTAEANGIQSTYQIYNDNDEKVKLEALKAITSSGFVCGQCFHEYKAKYKWAVEFPKPHKGNLQTYTRGE